MLTDLPANASVRAAGYRVVQYAAYALGLSAVVPRGGVAMYGASPLITSDVTLASGANSISVMWGTVLNLTVL